MKKSVKPSPISGSVKAPASKSYAQRAVAAALLAEGTSVLSEVTLCDDTRAAIGVARALGADIIQSGRTLTVKGGLAPRSSILPCVEAGLCMRMFSAIAACGSRALILTGRDSLSSRPIGFIEAPLRQLGAHVQTTDGCPPVTVEGPLRGGEAHVDGSISSQFITGLILATPCCPQDTVLRVSNPKSTPYLDMTMEVVRAFGVHVEHENYEIFRIPGGQAYRCVHYTVEGDWSGAAFLLVAGAVAGPVQVSGLNIESLQADRAIIEALRMAGANMNIGPGAVELSPGELQAFKFDATNCPDLFPPLVCLATFCRGISEIRGVTRLKYKESDRATVLCREFGRMGVKVAIDGDLMHVHGSRPAGAVIDSHGDHRIAMAAAVAGLRAQAPITIAGAECVAKSYPGFYDDLSELGARIAG